MQNEIRILMVEDSAADAELEVRELKRAGIACLAKRVENESDFRSQLLEFAPDIIISDFSLPRFDGLSALRIARAEQPNIPFIFVSGTIGEEGAIDSLKRGASDYILKGNSRRLPQAVLRAIRNAEDRQQRIVQDQKVSRLSRVYAMLSGINSSIARVRDRQSVFTAVSRIAVEHGQFRVAWIGIPQSGATELEVVAWNGPRDSGPDEVAMAGQKKTADHGPGRQALREKRAIVLHDIGVEADAALREDALKYGYRSILALPLLVQDSVVAVCLIYAAEPHFFDEEGLSLLTQLAGDVSFALEFIDKEEQLNHLAYHDMLTGLPNRNLMHDRITQAISHSKRLECMAAVAVIDLDHFKLINDSLGHNAGDHLLQVVAKRLASCLRDGDTVARMGGDEFVMVLPEQADAEVTSQVMQRVLAVMRMPIASQDGEIKTSCSIGVALYPQDGVEIETLLKHADAAMYRAKNSGRNSFQFYAQEMNAQITERLLLESKLRLAIQREELFLDYQPKMDFNTGKIVGNEALVRWQSPELGLVAPAKFIPVAEASDLILSIGEWVLRKACAQNKAWQDMGLQPVQVSVNVSARQFRDGNLPVITRKILRETGMDPRYLDLELTENVVTQNVDEAFATMLEFDAMGVELSIDNFGTGYSSLSYLKRFPIVRLKIDKSFVRTVVTDPDDAAIAQAVISLGHSLGLKVVAEGVETREQLAFLRAHQCDEVQGYYYSKPVDAEQIAALLRARTAAA